MTETIDLTALPSFMPETVPTTPDPILPIQLIALDIDGTIIGDDHEVSARTVAAVRAAMERDVAVSLVTGRMVSSAMRFARQLRLSAPLVGYQGGLIRAIPDPGSRRLGKLLLHTPLPASAAQRILRWTRDRGLDPHVNHLERFILRADWALYTAFVSDQRSTEYRAVTAGVSFFF